MSDDQPQGPDIESLEEELRSVVDDANDPDDLDLEKIGEILGKVPPNEKRKQPAWLDLENLVRRKLQSGMSATDADFEDIYGLTDTILGK